MNAERIDIGWVDPEYVSGHFAHSIAVVARDLQYHGAAGRIFRRSAPQQNMARNAVVTEFLNESDSPWLWFVDGDMVVDKGHVLKLWECASEFEADIVAGLAFIWKEEKVAVPSYFYRNEQGEIGQIPDKLPKRGAEIAASGLATALIHRRVFEEMKPHRHPDYPWFDLMPNEEIGINGNEMTGVDVAFFTRARNLGFKMVAEPTALTWHLETLPVNIDIWRKQWNPD